MLEEPPVGIALRVPVPRSGIVGKQTGQGTSTAKFANTAVDEAGLCDFDELSLPEVGISRHAYPHALPAHTIFPIRCVLQS